MGSIFLEHGPVSREQAWCNPVDFLLLGKIAGLPFNLCPCCHHTARLAQVVAFDSSRSTASFDEQPARIASEKFCDGMPAYSLAIPLFSNGVFKRGIISENEQ